MPLISQMLEDPMGPDSTHRNLLKKTDIRFERPSVGHYPILPQASHECLACIRTYKIAQLVTAGGLTPSISGGTQRRPLYAER